MSIKYIGSKAGLVDKIKPYMGDCDCIIEPFAGSASFSLSQGKPFYFIDMQPELVNFMKVLVSDCESLLAAIEELDKKCKKESDFMTVRAFDRNPEFESMGTLFRAARYYYIIYKGYNGMYRVNQKGQCNTPWGHDTQNIPKNFKEMLRADSKAFKENCLGFYNENFNCVELLDKLLVGWSEPFVLIDPPYYDTFDQYTKDRPDPQFWEDLKTYVDDLQERGIRFLLTNSYHEFILDLFKEYPVEKVDVHYKVAADSKKRGKKFEAFITNKA